MGKGVPKLWAISAIGVAAFFLSACGVNQEEIESLEREVASQKEEKRQVFDRLSEAEAERDQAQSALSLAQDDLDRLRSRVSRLRQDISALETENETLYQQQNLEPYREPTLAEDCDDFDRLGVDCPYRIGG